MKVLNTEYWLAEFSETGTPTLEDGPHSTYDGAERAMHDRRMPLFKKDYQRILGVVKVETLIQMVIPK